MNFTEKQVLAEGKYLAKRVMHNYSLELYLWNDRFFEVAREYCQDCILKVQAVEDNTILDLYIQAMTRTGSPHICDRDRFENLREVGKLIQGMLEEDHSAFLNELYWDEKLHWFCQVIEVRAAYLVDDIIARHKGMLVTVARDIALHQLLENPKEQVKPPYIKLLEKDHVILFPWWMMNRYSQQHIIMEDMCPCGNGIKEVLGVLDAYGGWENATEEQFWEEQKQLMEAIRKKYEQPKGGKIGS